jgi:hypothetical protein
VRLTTDHESLSVAIELDTEHPDVDLTEVYAGGQSLGDLLIDLAVLEMQTAVLSGRSPSGEAWQPNATSTKERKGHGLVGFKTGEMLDPSHWEPGDRDVSPRSARWRYTGPAYARHFHQGNPSHGQPPRNLVGWSAQAEDLARQLVADASHRADD